MTRSLLVPISNVYAKGGYTASVQIGSAKRPINLILDTSSATLPGWPNQAILGLPLLKNYYTIFKRAAGDNGYIEFASEVFTPHTLSTEQHQNHDALRQRFSDHDHLL